MSFNRSFSDNPHLVLIAVVLLASVVFIGVQFSTFSDTVGETFRDTEVSDRDDAPALIIQMPNGYSNVAFKCNDGTGVYVTKHGDGRAVAVAPNDPACVGVG